ncbi:Cytosolic carboxypeptidase 2 [Tritrichomonas foetus]|uniref:Cytosolic carboxypeptidase 2 n=1 Tax=Tritrichomonas foetus TaxID=1144522 RepID=A0A1J4KA42_9EUKA|nr:Cytosolic carboxypeptidase 2 [Tritrichomonas foetus]|eukprot:OHT06317.1 Cytosolic carboxypeptidase 2 [Tritrichomonas foetus]
MEEVSKTPIFRAFSETSVKELRSINHPGISDTSRSTFSYASKKPFWPEVLWKGGTLVYSMKQPEKCLVPPVLKNDKTIRFNSRFESGNLMYAYRLNPDAYHCILEYDHTPSGGCQWFYFQMSNLRKDRKVTFYISGFNKNSGVFSSGSKVFMYSEKAAQLHNLSWFRAGTNYAYGTTLKNKHNKRSTLQFQLQFQYDDDVCYLCYALPYTYTDLTKHILDWSQFAPSLIKKEILCKTLGGRDCPILTITSPFSSTFPSTNTTKKCIFLTARIHPGESNGSIVLHGLIDYLLSGQPIAQTLLEKYIFKIVPMINIDGVIEGFYRTGLEGDDLNRVWSLPDPEKHPVVFATKNLMFSLHQEIGIVAYIDFHGHSRQHGTFAYGCPSDSNKEKYLPKMIAYLCDAFSWAKCVFSVPQQRKDASRCVVAKELGVVNSFTIESSFGGILSGPRTNTLYNDTIWKEIGARIGESLFHLFSESSPLLKLIECNTAIFPKEYLLNNEENSSNQMNDGYKNNSKSFSQNLKKNNKKIYNNNQNNNYTVNITNNNNKTISIRPKTARMKASSPTKIAKKNTAQTKISSQASRMNTKMKVTKGSRMTRSQSHR